jgi:hypothetical protein
MPSKNIPSYLYGNVCGNISYLFKVKNKGNQKTPAAGRFPLRLLKTDYGVDIFKSLGRPADHTSAPTAAAYKLGRKPNGNLSIHKNKLILSPARVFF